MNINEIEVRHRYAQINGAQIHYIEAGPEDGPLTVLLHGFPEMWWCWRYQIRALADAGHRVLAPDLRGYNDSEKTGPYDLETLAEDVRGLIRYAGASRANIVGHDWGGAIAWQLAATFPEACERVAVLNCPHPRLLLRALRSRPRQLLKSWYIFAFQLPRLPEIALTSGRGKLIKAIYRANAIDRSNFGDQEIAPMVEAMSKPGAAAAAVEYYRTILRQSLKPSGRRRLAPVQSRTLLIWAKKDAALDFDSLVPGTQEYVPDLRVETIEDCGHFVQEEQPERVNELLLDFLGKK